MGLGCEIFQTGLEAGAIKRLSGQIIRFYPDNTRAGFRRFWLSSLMVSTFGFS